jgi:hypothetical protein
MCMSLVLTFGLDERVLTYLVFPVGKAVCSHNLDRCADSLVINYTQFACTRVPSIAFYSFVSDEMDPLIKKLCEKYLNVL